MVSAETPCAEWMVVALAEPVEVGHVERQPDGQLAAGVPHGQVTAPADAGDGAGGRRFDPVGRGESESAVVAAGDDHLDLAQVPVGQGHLRCRLGVIKTMRPGAAVPVRRPARGWGRA